MTTKALADALGLTRRRNVASSNVNGSTTANTHTAVPRQTQDRVKSNQCNCNTQLNATVRTPSSSSVLSHRATQDSTIVCRIPTPTIRVISGQTGTCAVCMRANLHVVNSTGLIRNHGPRGNECIGSRSRPLQNTIHHAVGCRRTQPLLYIEATDNARHHSSQLTAVNKPSCFSTQWSMRVVR